MLTQNQQLLEKCLDIVSQLTPEDQSKIHRVQQIFKHTLELGGDVASIAFKTIIFQYFVEEEALYQAHIAQQSHQAQPQRSKHAAQN